MTAAVVFSISNSLRRIFLLLAMGRCLVFVADNNNNGVNAFLFHNDVAPRSATTTLPSQHRVSFVNTGKKKSRLFSTTASSGDDDGDDGGFPPLPEEQQPGKSSSSSSSSSTAAADKAIIALKKHQLLQSLDKLRTLQERDGDFSIDFGVKGGEINATDRAPREVNYYSISRDVGEAADRVFHVCDWLSQLSPINEPTEYLGDKTNGNNCPLNGKWRQLFTNSADAVFSKNSTRGDANACVVIDGPRGRIQNIIDFAPVLDNDGTTTTEPVLKKLVVNIKAKAVSKTRVSLRFLYVKAIVTKFFGIPLFGKKLPIYIPVPSPFIARIVIFFANLFRLLFRSKQPRRELPKAYFDVLYLDDNLRIQRTAQGNLFVQAKESWEEAKPLLK